ncbi:MAG: archaeosortase/exosortase family protein [Cyclobacteriaceae bacterium]
MANKISREGRKKLVKIFLIRSGITYLMWQITYYGFILPHGKVNLFLTNLVIKGTVFGLDLLGYETIGEGRIVTIDSEPVVLVGDSCNGLELFVLYSGFLLCFPGKIKYKLFFIPIGISIIFILNVIREITLSLNYKFFRESFEFNHKYTYVMVVYLTVFAIWRFWLKKYSAISSN